jgi:hypothetical protein
MDEARALARDRRLYHLHAATLLVGVFGMIASVGLTEIIIPRVALWLAAGFAAVLIVSGVLAIIVKRTLFSKDAEDTHGFDFEGHPGDALETPGIWTTNLNPYFTNAVAPYTVLLVGLIFFVLFVFGALR